MTIKDKILESIIRRIGTRTYCKVKCTKCEHMWNCNAYTVAHIILDAVYLTEDLTEQDREHLREMFLRTIDEVENDK